MNRFRNPLSLLLFSIAAFALVGFGTMQVLESDSLGASAQQPEPTSGAELSLQAERQINQVESDQAKPRFIGAINGIEFVEQGQVISPPPTCIERRVEAEVGPDEVRRSDLNFSPGYLPANLELVYEAGTVCQDQVIHVVKNYAAPGGSGLIVIARSARDPIMSSDAPEDRLEATTIGGNPAVLEHPAYDGGKAAVYIWDGETLWHVWSQFLPEDEIRSVAEGLGQF